MYSIYECVHELITRAKIYKIIRIRKFLKITREKFKYKTRKLMNYFKLITEFKRQLHINKNYYSPVSWQKEQVFCSKFTSIGTYNSRKKHCILRYFRLIIDLIILL